VEPALRVEAMRNFDAIEALEDVFSDSPRASVSALSLLEEAKREVARQGRSKKPGCAYQCTICIVAQSVASGLFPKMVFTSCETNTSMMFPDPLPKSWGNAIVCERGTFQSVYNTKSCPGYCPP
jgi:hypothetical protein